MIESQEAYGRLTMQLDHKLEKEIIESLDLEMEVLHGNREHLPCGKVKITCDIPNKTKYDIVYNFLLRFIANCENKINPN